MVDISGHGPRKRQKLRCYIEPHEDITIANDEAVATGEYLCENKIRRLRFGFL